eukprot:NODE_118_length_18907_cov_0.436251.p8 type:complete len:126 gc:universal NODE_118_length_18907_cov_0.436251:4419-4796(+)
MKLYKNAYKFAINDLFKKIVKLHYRQHAFSSIYTISFDITIRFYMATLLTDDRNASILSCGLDLEVNISVSLNMALFLLVKWYSIGYSSDYLLTNSRNFGLSVPLVSNIEIQFLLLNGRPTSNLK